MSLLARIRQRLEFRRNNTKVWRPSNVYTTAKIGRNVSIGKYSEISGDAVIGNDVRVGALCFVPGGVTIEDGAWIGPKCTFTNDRYPPSRKDQWEKTVVGSGAVLSANVTVRCGVTIGSGAIVGCGSVVTKDVPDGETWAGVPAKKIR